MILREWRGRASHEEPDAYPKHFRNNVAPELRTIDGFLGASLLRADRSDGIEFLVLTRWTSFDAIHAFAGDEIGKAVVEPEAAAALVDFDEWVRHYELIEEVGSAAG
jgi:heme-degrading monooxygenase HmoA